MAAFFQDVFRLFEKKMFVAGWIWGKILWVIILDFLIFFMIYFNSSIWIIRVVHEGRERGHSQIVWIIFPYF